MIVPRAYKTELKPNNKQRRLLTQYAGTARFVYNWGLAEWKRQYKADGKPSSYKLRKQFNAQKDRECPWVRLMPYAITEAAFGNLHTAFQHFFRRIKNSAEKAGYPRFKKRGVHDSFQVKNTGVEIGRVRITHLGWVRLKERDYLPTTNVEYGLYATVSRVADKWFISIPTREEIPSPSSTRGRSLGIDFGIKTLAVCSDGTTFENPRALQQQECKMKRLQRELARRKKGSNNRHKTRMKLARHHAKIARIRAHTLHQISHYAVVKAKPQQIVIEDLNVRGMLQNHNLARAISDVGFGELRRQIEYKALWHGVEVVVADRWYPSSKTCSGCGSVKPLLSLSERTYVCEECGCVLDRDMNAALNLANYTVKHTGINACEENVRPTEIPLAVSLKQEAGIQLNPV